MVAKINSCKQRPQKTPFGRCCTRLLAGACVLFLLAGVVGPIGPAGAEDRSASAQRLDALSAKVAQDYPDVRHISVAELKRDFGSALLVDVRKRDEFDRSHLPGAVHAPTPAAVDALRAAHPQQTLVFYCTVGVRSSIAVRELQERDADSTNAVNLAGSIFAWSNAGEPLQDSAGPTLAVHPYNFWWGMRYLDPPASEERVAPET